MTRADLPKLPDIDELRPVGPEDQPCLDELKEVLIRHGALSRFGINLLHQHFEIGANEVLVEGIDEENRVLVIQPKILSEVRGGVETSWRLDDPVGRQLCEVVCQSERDYQGVLYHNRKHIMTG